MSHGYEEMPGVQVRQAPLKYIRWETTGIPGIILLTSGFFEMNKGFPHGIHDRELEIDLLRATISAYIGGILVRHLLWSYLHIMGRYCDRFVSMTYRQGDL